MPTRGTYCRNGCPRVHCLAQAETFIDDMAASHSTDLQQRAYELKGLLALPRGTAAAVMPEDASCEDIEVRGNRRGWEDEGLGSRALGLNSLKARLLVEVPYTC